MHITPADLTPLATPDVMGVFGDRRQDRRVGITGVRADVRVIGPGVMGQTLACGVRDVSRDGLALSAAAEVADAGTRLHVAIIPPDGGGDAVTLLCTVRWSRRTCDGFAVGCDAGVSWDTGLCDLLFPPDLFDAA